MFLYEREGKRRTDKGGEHDGSQLVNGYKRKVVREIERKRQRGRDTDR